MALGLSWPVRHRIVEGALCLLFVGASGDLRSAKMTPYLYAFSGNVSSLGSPFHPSPIVDPFSDVNCKDEACHHKSEPCKDYPLRICDYYDHCGSTVCLHKNLFPMLADDLLLFVAMFLIAVFAGAAGIGGGGLNVPILMMLNSFGIKEAVPLSHGAVMGNAFAQLMINAPQRHPSAPHRPLIHYELALLVLPAILGGNSLGVVIGRIFPPTLLIILSLVMLALATFKTFTKGVHVFQEFRERNRSAKLDTAPASRVPSLQPQEGRARTPSMSSPNVGAPRIQPTLSQDLRLPAVNPTDDMECVRTWSGTAVLPRSAMNELWSRNNDSNQVDTTSDSQVKMRIPWKVISFMIMFNIVFCMDFLVMSPDIPYVGVEKCSPGYWVALLGLYPFVAASLWIGIRYLKVLAAYHANRGNERISGDPEINARLVVLFPTAAVVIGLVAGLVGLGGGEFMVPLLLEFGLLPRVASATSGFLILFTTSSNIVHYFIAGTMEPFAYYGVGVALLAFFGALVGLGIRDTKYMREHNYLLVFLLAGLLTVSAGLLSYRGFFQSKMDWSFKAFCDG